MRRPPFATARFSWLVERAGSKKVVFAHDTGSIAAMGSNTKLFTVGTWLDVEGPSSRIHTPVYAVGNRTGSTLTGNLVLRASGDLVMGGRKAGSGKLAYSIPPQPDANGLPGAEPAPGDPLAGLDSLAAQVAEAGITQVDGNVVVDDRLFRQWDTTGGPISPIVVNDNLVDVVTTPTTPGSPPSIRMIPQTDAFHVVDQATTVGTGTGTGTSVTLQPQLDAAGNPTNTLVLTGHVAAGSKPLLNVYQVPDPASYARTLFIEALARAGVTTTADPTAVDDTSGLPAFDSYQPDQQVASLTSPPISQIATLIWKISHNYGANLAVCLLAVQRGSTTCEDGLQTVRQRITRAGIPQRDVWILNGAGSQFSSVTPDAMVAWLQWLHDRSWGKRLPGMLPILGVDGSLSLAGTHSPSKGKVQAKTGTWAGVDPGTGRLLVPDQSLAGFMESGGKRYVFALYMNGGSFDSPSKIIKSNTEVAGIAAAFQQAL